MFELKRELVHSIILLVKGDLHPLDNGLPNLHYLKRVAWLNQASNSVIFRTLNAEDFNSFKGYHTQQNCPDYILQNSEIA